MALAVVLEQDGEEVGALDEQQSVHEPLGGARAQDDVSRLLRRLQRPHVPHIRRLHYGRELKTHTHTGQMCKSQLSRFKFFKKEKGRPLGIL